MEPPAISIPIAQLPEAIAIYGPTYLLTLDENGEMVFTKVSEGYSVYPGGRIVPMEKRGVVDEQNTRPETPDEKDLEQHPTKRAADVIGRPKSPPAHDQNTTNAERIAERAKDHLDR